METDELCRLLDAIALGIEVQFDPLMEYSKTIIRKTKQVAQQIDFPGSAVQHCEENRRKQIEIEIKATNRITLMKD